MKPSEYRGMSDEQLSLTLKEVTKNLFHLRFQSATERLETPSEIRKARREVARIQTIVREREIVKAKEVAKEEAAKAKAAAVPAPVAPPPKAAPTAPPPAKKAPAATQSKKSAPQAAQKGK
jgi:large subunit ribosomal protein L29